MRLLAGVAAVLLGSVAPLPASASATEVVGTAVVGWGASSHGEATAPAGLPAVTGVAAGAYHNLALTRRGTVIAWGRNDHGQATVPAGLAGVTGIAAGSQHSLAVKRDGTVVAWGWNDHGQATVPAGLAGVTAIAAGGLHSLALKGDGTVVGWGYNAFGQVNVPAGLSGVTAIAAGDLHSLALKGDGTVVGWGYNAFGEVNVPAGLSGVIAIAAGDYHSLALKGDGTVVSWGWTGNGKLRVPAGLSRVTAIAAGFLHNLAVKDDGTVVAWGDNSYGQRDVPAGLSGVTAIDAGYGHSLASVRAPDTTAPTLELPAGVKAPATGVDGAVVAYSVSASDDVDDHPQVSCSPPSGAVFPLGATTVRCTATDRAGNTATGSFPVTVTFPWSGVLPPVDPDGSSVFHAGRTVPVKFTLVGTGAGVTDAVATLSYAEIGDGSAAEPAPGAAAATPVAPFRYSDGTYLCTWRTKGLAPGGYLLGIDLGDGVDRTVRVTLR